VVDKSWGVSGPSEFRVRSNASLQDRAAARAKAREERASERALTLKQQLEEKAVRRAADVAAREQARTQRREAEMRVAADLHAADPHAAAAARHRSSGRKDIVREDRDISAYTIVVDHRRMRELAARGATISGLASAFGISQQDVERVLSADE
jgi:hypothetical protein